ncbi:hypothetical protein CSE16_00690 [Solibacillus sp. R5-41]|uniref:DUF4179 domain-containing protein n=1 Tax=Solibacillus sp. R5-41 TaxID=2048654 RepID=UPI000C125BDF|nr:DUF4179 domain-containing protein [Solibacillus sp. R5-41]ATP38666.1 hypothetical protein CSE16_00690 [Solibacillus sp. R5-41]
MNTRSKQEDKEVDQLEKIIRETPVEVDLVNRTMSKYESSRDTKPSEKIRTRKKLRQRVIMITASAAMIFSLIIVTGLISPTMAATMKEVPLFSSIFKFARDLGLQAADEKGLSTKLNTSVTHEGFTLNVTEVVYDGTRVVIGIERPHKEGESSNETLLDRISDIDFLLNGKVMDPTIFSGTLMHPTKDNNSAIFEFADMKNQGGEPFPKQFNLTLSTTIKGISEPFTFDIPMKSIGDNNVILQPKLSRQHNNIQFSIDQIELTPITTLITTRTALLDKSIMIGSQERIHIKVFDEQGHVLQWSSGIGGRETNDGSSDFISGLRSEPFETLPKALTIKPYIYLYNEYPKGSFKMDENGEPIIQYIPELEVTIPINSQQ